MSTTPKAAITGDVLETTATTGYTVPSGVTFTIHRLTFTNFHAAADAVIDVYLVPQGSTAIDDHKIASDQKVSNDRTWPCIAAEGHVLATGATIQYTSDVPDAVTAICSGVEITA